MQKEGRGERKRKGSEKKRPVDVRKRVLVQNHRRPGGKLTKRGEKTHW